MAKRNIFDLILNTINDVQEKNEINPYEETADASVFDLIKNKLQKLDEKSKQNRISRGKSPSSLMDRIRKEIQAARRENKKDPNVETAPKSVFDQIIRKIDDRPRRQATAGIRGIIEEYNLDISRLPKEVMQKVQAKYQTDRRNFDRQFAQDIHDLIKQH